MFYAEIKPSRFLEEYVKCFWILEQDTSVVSAEPELILPDGCTEIVFNLASPFRRYHKHKTEIQPQTIVVGQMQRSVLIKPIKEVCLFGIRFKPTGIFPVVRQSLEDLTDRIENVENVLGKYGREIEARINEAKSHKARITIIENTLAKFYRACKYGNLSAEAAQIIYESKGRARIGSVVKTLETTSKKLERQFKREIGLTPKFFSRVVRLQTVLKYLSGLDRYDWADTAYLFGYADQSHLIKDFNGIAGMSPRLFQKQQTPLNDSFVG